MRVGVHHPRQQGAAGHAPVGRPAEGSHLRDAAVVADHDLDAGLEALAGPGEVGLDLGRRHARSSAEVLDRPRQEPARRREFVLGEELVRLVGHGDRAGAEDGAVEPHPLEPAGVGGEGDARPRLLADQGAEVAVDGGARVEQQGRAVREQLDRGLEGGGGGAGGGGDALDQLRRGIPGSGRKPTSTAQRSGTTLIAAPPCTVPRLSGT